MAEKNGFTLIELLVVIAIVGILSIAGVAYLRGPREKARDSQAWIDVNHVRVALAQFYAIHHYYPGCSDNPNGWSVGADWWTYHCINESYAINHSVRPFRGSIWTNDLLTANDGLGVLVGPGFLRSNFGKLDSRKFYRYTASNYGKDDQAAVDALPSGVAPTTMHYVTEEADAYVIGFESEQLNSDYKVTIDSDGQVVDVYAHKNKISNCTKPIRDVDGTITTPGNCKQ